MAEGQLPEALARFLEQHITSIELLEVLLLLRSTAEQEWSAAEVTRALGSSLSSIRGRLADLMAKELLSSRAAGEEPLYRYAPDSDETRQLVDALARTYKERRLSIINFIYGRPASDIQSFADAFAFVKRGKDSKDR